MLVGAGDDGIAAKDVLLSARLWRAAFRRLPATRKPVWLGGWSLTALVCGAAVVAGFSYWPEAMKSWRLRQVAEAQATDAPPEATAKDTAPGAKGPGEPGPAGGESRPVAQCVVIGYQTDGRTVTGLVLATAEGDHLKFAGVVHEGLTPALCKELMERLSALGRDRPLVPGLQLKGTTWVKPGVFCGVSHAGADKEGQLKKPEFKELMD
jgi:hypothetical protein